MLDVLVHHRLHWSLDLLAVDDAAYRRYLDQCTVGLRRHLLLSLLLNVLHLLVDHRGIEAEDLAGVSDDLQILVDHLQQVGLLLLLLLLLLGMLVLVLLLSLPVLEALSPRAPQRQINQSVVSFSSQTDARMEILASMHTPAPIGSVCVVAQSHITSKLVPVLAANSLPDPAVQACP